MKTIHELPKELQAKLAAGEVIERPAYIVKELVDNALDAGAKNIRIDVEKSGLQKIVVTDDGRGMSKEDLEICFKQFTTSKIFFEEDLNTIETMGFRGEALSSISAIAQLTIRSRKYSEIGGNEALIEKGQLKKLSPKGMPVGTQVIVEDIFSSVPARKKFLKSEMAEYRSILDIIFRYALAFPEVRFDVFHEGKKVQLLIPNTLANRLAELFSQDQTQYFLPIQLQHDYFTIKGFISKPQLSYKSSRHIYHFVNKRFFTDHEITRDIKDVYGTLLEPAYYPHVVLFIDIPFHLVDVNVHPRKEEVHFTNKDMILEGVQEAVRQALSSADLRFYDKRWSGDDKEFEQWQIRDGGTDTYAAKKLKKVIKDTVLNTISTNDSLFQFHNLYIAVPTKKGVIFFDQHAVHERILYEKLQHSLQEEIKAGQHVKLEKPKKYTINPKEKTLLEEYNMLLSEIGFDFVIEDDEITFISVPQLLHDQDVSVILRQVLDALFEKGERISFEVLHHKMIAYLACRSAVKAGDYLSSEQCRDLIEQLKKTENPYSCPHGRPTQVEIGLDYFHKLFKRK